jgi:hypothetical protein
VKYVEMSDRDVYALEALYKCNIRPGTVTKKWVTIMYKAIENNRLVTDFQIKEIWRLISEFRSHIKDKDLVAESEMRLL